MRSQDMGYMLQFRQGNALTSWSCWKNTFEKGTMLERTFRKATGPHLIVRVLYLRIRPDI